MGRANISIAITSNFNSRGIDAAIKKAEQLSVAYVHAKGKFGNAAVDFGASMGMAGARLAAMGKAVADLGDRLTMGLTVPMGLAGAATVMAAAKIDTAWYNVRKTVDMTEEGYERLKQSAMELSETQPVDAETILNIEALGGQLGITNGYLEDFARVVSGLDISTNMDFETSASSLAQFRNIVQMSEEDLDNWASTVVDLGNHTATTEADMVNLAMRFASAGHIAGMSNAEILGMSAALAGLGMRAEAGGSAISRTINDINNSVAVGGENLQKWADLVGKTPEQFSEAWRAAPMEEFIDVLTHINEAGSDMGAVLEELGITQIRQSDAMRRLASSGDYVRETVERANEAWRQNSALTTEVERRNESLQARWDTFCNSIVNDAARIGEPLANLGLDFLEGLRPAIQGIGDLATSFANADPAVQRFAFNLAGVAMAAGPVLSVTGRLMQATGNMGVRVGRVVQQWGVYKEALNTTDVAMVRNLSEQKNLSTQLGLSRNEWVKSSGGIDQWKRNVQAATTVVEENARASVTNSAAVSAYADALGVGADSAVRFTGGVRSSLGAVQFATGVQERYRDALANGARSATEAAQIALQYGDNTADAAVAANRAANEALGYGGALKSQARSGTEAARSALKAADSRKVQRQATASAKSAVQDMTRAEMDSALASKRGQQELKKLNETAGSSTSAFGRFGDALKGALLGFGASAAIGAVVAGITWIATSMQEAAEHADLMDRATNGLRDSLHDVGDAATEAGNSQRDLIGSITETHEHVREAIESQAELAEKFREVDKQAAVQLGTIDRSSEVIERYANKGSIGAAQLSLLKSAIDDVNQACGTQYSVLADGTVVIEGETGAIQVNTDEILKNIEARKRQIQLDATESKYQSAYENLVDQTYARAEAQTKLNKARERAAEIFAKGENATDEETSEYLRLVNGVDGEINKLEQEVAELDETWRAASDTEQYWASLLESQGGTLENLSKGMQDLLGPTSMLTAYFSAAEKDVVAFAAACEEAGINWHFLNSLTETEVQQLAADFDGSTASIIESLEKLGKTEALDSLATNWRGKVGEAAYALAEGIANAHDVSVARIAALAHDLGIQGEEATRRFLEGLQQGLNSGLTLDQATALAERMAKEFEDGLSPEQAQQLAQNFIENLARGMGTQGALDAAINALKQSLSQVDFTFEGQHAASTFFAGFNLGGGGGNGNPIQPFTTTLTDHLDTVHNTVNEKGEVTGEDWGLSFGDGVNATAPTIPPVIQNAIAGLDPVLQSVILQAYASGSQVPGQYGQGVNDNAGAVTGAGDGLVAMLMYQLFGGVDQASGVGADTGQGYGNSVAAQGAVAEQAAINTLGRLLMIWLLGVASAQKAGERTGNAFGQGLASTAQKCITAAQAIGRATGDAFGVGTGSARSAGNSLGQAFASAVWSSGGQAIAYARSIRNSVKDIFDNVPTLNIKVNVQRNVTTTSSSNNPHIPQYASLPMPTPVMPVPGTASTSRAAVVAERAVQRVTATRSSSAAQTAQAVAATVRSVASQGTAIDYDAMYRVVRSGVSAAIAESGGLAPTVELDGRAVSRQLAPHMDYELGRIGRRRG